ncbi:MAG: diguanylate cyclase [Armatimonadetes bacterium]|nr:diguanylate cyclase [Armatimonadota bacterium]
MVRRSEDLAERLWPEKLQEIQDALSRSCAIPILVVEPSGRPLAACEDLSQFCRRYTRCVTLSRPCLGCGRSDRLGESPDANLSALQDRSDLHRCPLGLTDVAAPICSAGETLGLLLSAQVVLDEDMPRCPSGSSLGANDVEGWGELVARVPHVSRDQMLRQAATLSAAAWLLGALASARRRNLRLSDRLRRQSRWIQQQTVTDAVTGLLNRQRFGDTLEAEIRRVRRYKRPMSVAVLAIDGYREIDEEFGHKVGDAVLLSVANCLTSTLRQTDFIGRVDSDAFGVLLPETARHEAFIAMARVNAAIDDLNASGDLPVEVRLAVGVTDRVADGRGMLEDAYMAARCARELDAITA